MTFTIRCLSNLSGPVWGPLTSIVHPDKAATTSPPSKAETRLRQDKGSLTVNSARQAVETKLKLRDGFFRGDDWKARSKETIKEAVVSSFGSSG